MSKSETQTRSELINMQLARSGWFGSRFSIIEDVENATHHPTKVTVPFTAMAPSMTGFIHTKDMPTAA